MTKLTQSLTEKLRETNLTASHAVDFVVIGSVGSTHVYILCASELREASHILSK